MENKIENWLHSKIKEESLDLNQVQKTDPPQNPLIVTARHNVNQLNKLTKRQVVDYARAHVIAVNSRKKKHELIDIILRS